MQNVFCKIKLSFFLLTFLLLFPSLVLAKIPNDPSVIQWAFNDIHTYDAWDYIVGSREVVVAIIDNGFDIFHPDLIDNLWKNESEIPGNGIDDDNNGYIDDIWGWNFVFTDANNNGKIDGQEFMGNNDPRPEVDNSKIEEKNEKSLHHGTVVAGLIGAVGNNNESGAGLNWHVRLMNLKVVDNNGESTEGAAAMIKAIYYAVNNGADIINISMVSGVEEGIKEAIKYAYDNGVAVVAAAGNNMITLNDIQIYPICADADEPEQLVLGVTAIDSSHHLAKFSNVGSNCVDITAPGVSIYSTLRFSPMNGLPEKYGGPFSGTSFAAPLVSGTLALIKAIHPEWGPKKMYEAVLSTVHHTGGQDESDYANSFGKGLLQTDKAVRFALDQPFYVRVLRFLIGVDLKNGQAVKKETKSQKISNFKFTNWKIPDDIVVFTKDGQDYYLVAWQKSKTVREMVIYNNQGEKINSWGVSVRGPVKLAVGDLVNNKRLEVVVVPDYPDKNLYRIFDLDGRLLYERALAYKHEGVSLDLMYDYGTDKDQLVLLFKNKEKVLLQHYNSDLEVADQFLVGLKTRGIVAGGDFNGDHQKEYVVTAGKGESVQTRLLAADGTNLRQFYGYDSQFNYLSMVVGDYNRDGKDEFIIGEGGQSVSVWDQNVKRMAEWELGEGKYKILGY